MNVVCTGSGEFVEVQGTAEREPFDRKLLDQLLDLAVAGCADLTGLQRDALVVLKRPAPMPGPARACVGAVRCGAAAAGSRQRERRQARRAEPDPGRRPCRRRASRPGGVPWRARRRRDRRHVRGERPAQGQGARHVHRPAVGRRRLRHLRRRAERDAGRAVGSLVRRARRRPGTCACCSASSATCRTSAAARTSTAPRRSCCRPGGSTSSEGTLRGRLIREPRGSNGFGYDPIFVPEGHERTTAEMTPAEKDAISHRGRAFRALAPVIAALVG